MAISVDIPGGYGDPAASSQSPTDIELVPELQYVPSYGTGVQWITLHMEITGVNGQTPAFVVPLAKSVGASETAQPVDIVWSGDSGATWQQFDNISNVNNANPDLSELQFSNNSAFGVDTIRVAFARPFDPAELDTFEAANSDATILGYAPGFSSFEIDGHGGALTAPNGRVVPAIRDRMYWFSENREASKPVVLITAGNHPGETRAYHLAMDLLNAFVDCEEDARQLLANADVCLIVHNLQATYAGYWRQRIDAVTYDSNRIWYPDSESPSCRNIIEAINKATSGRKIACNIDIHNLGGHSTHAIYIEDSATQRDKSQNPARRAAYETRSGVVDNTTIRVAELDTVGLMAHYAARYLGCAGITQEIPALGVAHDTAIAQGKKQLLYTAQYWAAVNREQPSRWLAKALANSAYFASDIHVKGVMPNISPVGPALDGANGSDVLTTQYNQTMLPAYFPGVNGAQFDPVRPLYAPTLGGALFPLNADFTAELLCAVSPIANGNNQATLIGQGVSPDAGRTIFYCSATTGLMQAIIVGSAKVDLTATDWRDGKSRHLCIVRSGNNWQIWEDGVLKNTVTQAGSIENKSTYISQGGDNRAVAFGGLAVYHRALTKNEIVSLCLAAKARHAAQLSVTARQQINTVSRATNQALPV